MAQWGLLHHETNFHHYHIYHYLVSIIHYFLELLGKYCTTWQYFAIPTPEISRENLMNLLTPNVNYSGRTAPLTSKVAFYIFIQQI